MASLNGWVPTEVQCHVYVPPGARGRPIVLVHGARRNARTLFRSFVRLAARSNRVLISPVFSTTNFPKFQILSGHDRPLAAAHALREAVTGSTPPNVSSHEFDLIGVSGGAQFAHRYALLFPEHVHRLVVVAPGWYTRIDPSEPFPFGTAASAATAGREIEADAFLRIPIRVLVGRNDVARGRSLRQSRQIDDVQGYTRLERAESWVRHLESEASERAIRPRSSLEVFADTGHSFDTAAARRRLTTHVAAFCR